MCMCIDGECERALINVRIVTGVAGLYGGLFGNTASPTVCLHTFCSKLKA